MSPSQSALERGNPPPRRKSCTCCIKAKRRCDLGLPACLRCSQRGLECKYPPAPAPKRKATKAGRPADSSPADTDEGQPLEPAHWTPELETAQAATGPSLTPILTSASPTLDYNLNILDFFENALDDIYGPSMGGLPSALIPSPSTEVVFPTKSQKGLADLVEKTISTRLQYALDEIIKAPKMMITENQTPWCHRQLYEDYMPRSMQG